MLGTVDACQLPIASWPCPAPRCTGHRSPGIVHRASFTGLFKHLFDFVDRYALVGKPVLLAATGGGERHALILEHQLRPLFSFFQALTLPLGVYASDRDFDGHVISSPALQQRIDQAAERALPLIDYAARRDPRAVVSF